MKFGGYVLAQVILARSEIRAGLEREKLHGHGAPMLYAYRQKVVPRVHTDSGGEPFMRQETRSRRVVIAEDNDDMRAVIRELIESLGAEVAEAASGGDLIMLLTDEKPVDLLITDVRMPWMTWFQVSLAARNAGLTMPIIVVTAFGDDHLRAQVERLGSASLLSKPFRPEELLSLARSLLPS